MSGRGVGVTWQGGSGALESLSTTEHAEYSIDLILCSALDITIFAFPIGKSLCTYMVSVTFPRQSHVPIGHPIGHVFLRWLASSISRIAGHMFLWWPTAAVVVVDSMCFD